MLHEEENEREKNKKTKNKSVDNPFLSHENMWYRFNQIISLKNFLNDERLRGLKTNQDAFSPLREMLTSRRVNVSKQQR